MQAKLDISTWSRREHFEFFRKYDEPFFSICTEVDCTKAYKTAKGLKTSFFLYYLHKSTRAANLIDNFRYRIEKDEVLIHNRIDASATINREDGTFGFSQIAYSENYSAFEAAAQLEIDRVRSCEGLALRSVVQNVIHYSSIPWIRITSLTHARMLSEGDSVPKITFGKLTEVNGKKMMPVSVLVHHALMDASHVAQYLDKFQELLDA